MGLPRWKSYVNLSREKKTLKIFLMTVDETTASHKHDAVLTRNTKFTEYINKYCTIEGNIRTEVCFQSMSVLFPISFKSTVTLKDIF